jgi:hypothetical protein
MVKSRLSYRYLAGYPTTFVIDRGGILQPAIKAISHSKNWTTPSLACSTRSLPAEKTFIEVEAEGVSSEGFQSKVSVQLR